MSTFYVIALLLNGAFVPGSSVITVDQNQTITGSMILTVNSTSTLSLYNPNINSEGTTDQPSGLGTPCFIVIQKIAD